MKTCPATIDGKTGMRCNILLGVSHGLWHEAHGTKWNYDGRFAPRTAPYLDSTHSQSVFGIHPPSLDMDEADKIVNRGGELRWDYSTDHWLFKLPDMDNWKPLP